MQRLFHLILFAALQIPLVACAADLAPGTANEIGAGFSHDSLDKSYASWTSRFINGSHRFGKRHTVYAELRETQRFNLQDREISAGYYYPINATLTSLIEASVSPEHNVLPKLSVFGLLQKAFDGGWNVQAGLRHTQYNITASDLMSVAGEGYWGNYRAAYILFLGKPQGLGAASSHMGQLSYYYADRNFITLSLATGRQVESLGAGLGVLVTNVNSSSISGQYWLVSDWGLSYDAIVEHQGNLYLRKGIRFGLLHSF